MHIALIRRKYDLSGGAELSLRMLVQQFLQQGHRVSVLAQSWQGEPPNGMNFCAIASSGHGSAAKSFAVNALQTAVAIQPDVCLSLERIPGAEFFRAGDGCHRAWLEHRKPYSGFLKRLSFACNPRHTVQLQLEEKLFHSPSLKLVIANSRMVADEIAHFYNVDCDKIAVIYNPVDDNRLLSAYDKPAIERAAQELGVCVQDKMLLFLGTGFERKGLAFTIKALAHLPREVKLLVAGQGSTRLYAKLAKFLGVDDRIKFLGLYENPGLLLGLCSALVLPTIYDPCANACLEALAVGKPVVTTSNNGAKEFICQGVNGMVIEKPTDSGQLAQACWQALSLQQPVSARLNNMQHWVGQMSQALGVTASAFAV